jgi:predicted CopG family antitoxin
MVKTIHLNENVKGALSRMKQSPKESFEDVLVRLIKLSQQSRKEKDNLLIEDFKEIADENLKLTKEFEVIGNCFDWEGNDESL